MCLTLLIDGSTIDVSHALSIPPRLRGPIEFRIHSETVLTAIAAAERLRTEIHVLSDDELQALHRDIELEAQHRHLRATTRPT